MLKLAVPLLACASLVLAAAAAPAAPLAAERWQKRVVLVFAAGEGGAMKTQLDALLADRAALGERDMLVLAVSGERVAQVFGSASSLPDAATLRAAFRIDPATPFAVVLVGKDGGEKLRREAPVPVAEIFALIDAMPMRRSEMRR